MTRRQLLRRALGLTCLGGLAGTAYPFLEAKWCVLSAKDVTVPRLPLPFDGLRIAFLTDIHHGRFVPLPYIRSVIAQTAAARPDIVLLGGDFLHHGSHFAEPLMPVLGTLAPPLGVWSVVGNHDYYDGISQVRAGFERNGIRELTNRGTWLERGGARLRLCGVDDLWEGRPDLSAAIDRVRPSDCVLTLAHNPDFFETHPDERVSLGLSGHTHGGQIRIPGWGAPILPSKFGQKYAYGLVQAPAHPVYVSSGVGTVTPPVRLLRPPEIALLTLRSHATASSSDSPPLTAV